MTDVIRVECGNCGSTIKAPPKYQGKRVKCPKCSKGITIPAAEEEAELLDDDAFDDEDEFVSDDYEDYGDDVDEFEGAFGQSSAAPPRRSRTGTKAKRRSKSRRKQSSDSSGGGMFSFNGGVLGGLVAMVIAVNWFVVAWQNGIIFYYPPVMFIIGLVAFVKGLFGGD
jgi:hypothetical protein